MRFMVMVHPGDRVSYEAGNMPDTRLLENMGKFNEALIDAGIMLSGDGLHPATKGMRVHFHGAEPTVQEGPFANEPYTVGGFWIWQVTSKDEALAWAKRAPMEPGATLELRQMFEASDFGEDVQPQERQLSEKLQQQKHG